MSDELEKLSEIDCRDDCPEIEDMQNTINTLKSEVESVRNELLEKDMKVGQLETEKRVLITDNDNLEKEVETLKKELESVKGDLELAESELEDYCEGCQTVEAIQDRIDRAIYQFNCTRTFLKVRGETIASLDNGISILKVGDFPKELLDEMSPEQRRRYMDSVERGGRL